MRNERTVTVCISAPVEMTDEEIREALDITITEGLNVATKYVAREGRNAQTDIIVPLGNVRSIRSDVRPDTEYDFGREHPIDFDRAHYVGNSEDGVYFEAHEELPGKWYLYGFVDCDTVGFCDTIWNEVGPFNSYDRAIRVGNVRAKDWFAKNNV